jgi:hypothetical protein
MAGGLFDLYRLCESKQLSDKIFLPDNPFDCSLRRWAIEMDRRDKGQTGFYTSTPLPNPSPKFKSVIEMNVPILGQELLREAAPWELMTAAAIAGYRVHKQHHDLCAMFDLESVFDQSLLVWCIEAEQRSHKENPSLN